MQDRAGCQRNDTAHQQGMVEFCSYAPNGIVTVGDGQQVAELADYKKASYRHRRHTTADCVLQPV
jgi:hypothetical protein